MQSMKIKEKTSPQLLTYYGFSLHPYCPHCQQYHMTKIVKSSLVGLDKVLSFGVCEVTFFFSPQCICTVQLGPVYPGENRWLRRTGESMLQLWPKVIAAAQRLNEMGWHHGSESADCLISPTFLLLPTPSAPFGTLVSNMLFVQFVSHEIVLLLHCVYYFSVGTSLLIICYFILWCSINSFGTLEVSNVIYHACCSK